MKPKAAAPIMLGARPHRGGGMALKARQRALSFEAVKRQANDYLRRKGHPDGFASAFERAMNK